MSRIIERMYVPDDRISELLDKFDKFPSSQVVEFKRLNVVHNRIGAAVETTSLCH